MKAMGIICIVVGVLLAAFTSMNFFTKDKVVDAGNLELSKNKTQSIYWSPWIGVAVAGGGVLFLVFGTINGRKENTGSSASVTRVDTHKTEVIHDRP
jgi:hypothetical protein